VELKTNVLYYGDNLEILRKYIPDESIDLIYLDPPFNSNRSYNVLFRESGGAGSEAQIEAFEDTWNWAVAAATYDEIIRGPHQEVARVLKAMVDGLGHNDVTAYLCMMAVRLVELHRALKPTGSLYLHCDPTAGHYLRMVLDRVFGPVNFRNQIAWKRSAPKGHAYTRFPSAHDLLLSYAKSGETTWNSQFRPHSETYVKSHYTHVEPETRRRYRLDNCINPNPNRPNLTYEWNGQVRVWRWTKERMQRLHDEGRLVYTRTGIPGYKRYLDEMPGTPVIDVWDDISPINSQAQERLGYPTQKPLALLERIVSASSNPGDIVLDPFCGCGTAVHAAHKLGRRWIGIDITHLAISLIRRRMQNAFPGIEIEVIGEPVDLAGARELAQRDKYQFQWWALDRLGAQPVSGKKKGSDKGIDGVIPFFAGPKEDYRRVIVSVKGGEHVNVAMVRDLKGVLEREKEPIAVLLALAPPTKEMVTEAAAAGFYESEFWDRKFPRVQIVTVEEMLGGKRPDMPWGKAPFAKAPVEKEKGEQHRFQ
jgi:site-specific DNA-methyltransferase (adenine-specific)